MVGTSELYPRCVAKRLVYSSRSVDRAGMRSAQSRTRVRSAVEAVLDDKLPETYDRAVFTEKCNIVFDTMLNYASHGLKWAVAA